MLKVLHHCGINTASFYIVFLRHSLTKLSWPDVNSFCSLDRPWICYLPALWVVEIIGCVSRILERIYGLSKANNHDRHLVWLLWQERRWSSSLSSASRPCSVLLCNCSQTLQPYPRGCCSARAWKPPMRDYASQAACAGPFTDREALRKEAWLFAKATWATLRFDKSSRCKKLMTEL